MSIKIRNVAGQAKIKSTGNSKAQAPLEVFFSLHPI